MPKNSFFSLKTLLAAAALGLPTMIGNAASVDHSSEVAKQKRCKSDGELAKSFHGAEPAAVKAAYAVAAEKVKTKQLSSQKADNLRFLIYQGFSATSPEAAYMRGWAACMDGKYDFK